MTSPSKIRKLQVIRDLHPGTSSNAQCSRILAALVQFPIDTFEASRYLDCYDPRARVRQLRKRGEPIDTHPQLISTESGDRHRVGLYVLNPSKRGTTL